MYGTAGELYPTQVRTTAHGMSAGFAKCGALWASVWFNYLGGRQKFWLTACATSPPEWVGINVQVG